MGSRRSFLAGASSKLRESRNGRRKFWVLGELREKKRMRDVPKGHCAVYVGEHLRRFVIPTSYLHHSLFSHLLQKSADEFGFAHHLGIIIPCDEAYFERLTSFLENNGNAKMKKKNQNNACIGLPISWLCRWIH